MKRKTPFVAAALAAGLSFYSSCTPTEKAETKDYTQYVNTFIGAADNGHTFPDRKSVLSFRYDTNQSGDGSGWLALLF